MKILLRIAIALAFVPAVHADLIVMTDDVEAVLNAIPIPGAGSNGFTKPSASDMADWEQVIAALLEGDYAGAALLADVQAYDLLKLTDSSSGRLYYVLREKLFDPDWPVRGLGTFALYPAGRRLLNIQAPHPRYDGGTRSESIAIFLETGAAFLQIAGTHRCASSTPSPCDGTTGACRDAGDPPEIDYRVSDVAHYTNNFYQVTSNQVAALVPELVSISVHGFGPCDGSDPMDVSLAQISNGTGGTTSNSIATQLAYSYNSILASIYTGRGAGSCNATANEPNEVHRVGCPAFCGGTNVQGRWINGQTADPCGIGVGSAPLPERFLHIEQQVALRDDTPGATLPGIWWQITIDAIANTFEGTTWVDFNYPGPEAGSFVWPFDTLAEGVADAGLGGTVRVKPGVSTESTVISTPVTIVAGGV